MELMESGFAAATVEEGFVGWDLEKARTGVCEDAKADCLSWPTADCRVALMRTAAAAETGRRPAAIAAVAEPAGLPVPVVRVSRPATRPTSCFPVPALEFFKSAFKLEGDEELTDLYSSPGRRRTTCHRARSCRPVKLCRVLELAASSSHHFCFLFDRSAPLLSHKPRSSSSCSQVHGVSIYRV